MQREGKSFTERRGTREREHKKESECKRKGQPVHVQEKCSKLRERIHKRAELHKICKKL